MSRKHLIKNIYLCTLVWIPDCKTRHVFYVVASSRLCTALRRSQILFIFICCYIIDCILRVSRFVTLERASDVWIKFLTCSMLQLSILCFIYWFLNKLFYCLRGKWSWRASRSGCSSSLSVIIIHGWNQRIFVLHSFSFRSKKSLLSSLTGYLTSATDELGVMKNFHLSLKRSFYRHLLSSDFLKWSRALDPFLCLRRDSFPAAWALRFDVIVWQLSAPIKGIDTVETIWNWFLIPMFVLQTLQFLFQYFVVQWKTLITVSQSPNMSFHI